MNQASWSNLEHLWLPYTQMNGAALPFPVVSASGVRLRLADGRELIDGVSSWWTACHGYGHPHIVEAITAQLQRMSHVMFGGLTHEPACRLAKRLAALLPGDLDHVFFSESGSIAVEVALKMAVQFWLNQGRRKTKFVSFRHGYHGDSFAAMSICDPEEGMHKLFRGVVPEQLVVDLPQTMAQQDALALLLEKHAQEVAAVIIEPLVQGAGGMKFHDSGVLGALRSLCNRYDLLLIFDEIFTAFGRTGTLFAMQQSGVTPDIVCLAKALTGGALPLAATVASRRVFEAFLSDDPETALMHGPTYMAYPLGCAAANASLDLFEREPRLEQAAAIAAQLREELAPCVSAKGVVDVRVKGAIGVLQMDRAVDSEALRARFVAKGVWIKPFGNIIYLTPPLVIGSDDLSRLTQAIREVLHDS